MTDSESHTDPREELRDAIARALFAKGVEGDLWNNIHEEWDLLGAKWHDALRELADAALLASEQFTIGLREEGDGYDLSTFVDYETIGRAIGESVYLSSQGFDEWPTLDQCVAAGQRASHEIVTELTDALRWRSHICAVPPGDGRVVVLHRDRYDQLCAKAGEVR